MRHVTLLARLPQGDPAEVFEKLIAFERYPALVDPVRTIEVKHISETEIDTRWSVFFRKGILNWAEKDFLDRETLTITFDQTEGDFDVLNGSYRVEPTTEGCDIHFNSTFDFGVSSIESIVEPIAARVLKENFELVLIGLLGAEVFFPPADEQPAETIRPRHAVFDYAEAPDVPGLRVGAAGAAAGSAAGANAGAV